MSVYDKEYPGELNARLFAVGPFSAKVAEHLPYSARHYKDTAEGRTIVRWLFDCWGESMSRELADCFEIDPWDFNDHKVNPWVVDIEKLRRLFPKDVNDFVALRDAGFTFFFVPHGRSLDFHLVR